jgi:hypothetical protein
MTNLCAGAPVLFKQRIGIFDADPNPAATMSLVALAQEDVALAAVTDAKYGPCQLTLNPSIRT